MMLADVDAGTDTPSFVSRVLSFRKENRAEGQRLWDSLERSNGSVAEAIAGLVRLEGSKGYDEALRRAAGKRIDEVSGKCGSARESQCRCGGSIYVTVKAFTGKAIWAAVQRACWLRENDTCPRAPGRPRLTTQVDRSTPTGDLLFRLAEALAVSRTSPNRIWSNSTNNTISQFPHDQISFPFMPDDNLCPPSIVPLLCSTAIPYPPHRVPCHTAHRARQTTRAHLRALSAASGVPVEPPEQTRLLDQCSALPGVIGGGVPGGELGDLFMIRRYGYETGRYGAIRVGEVGAESSRTGRPILRFHHTLPYIPYCAPKCPSPSVPLFSSLWPRSPPRSPPCFFRHALPLFSLSFSFSPAWSSCVPHPRDRDRERATVNVLPLSPPYRLLALTTSSGRLRRHLPPCARRPRRRRLRRRHLGNVFGNVGLPALGEAERWGAPRGDGQWGEGAR